MTDAEILELRKQCDRAGVKYHHRHGTESLRRLLSESNGNDDMPPDVVKALRWFKLHNTHHWRILTSYIEDLRAR